LVEMEAWETGTKARVRRFTERSTRDLDPCGLLGDAPRLWLSFKNPECLSRKPGLSRESKPGSSTDAGSGKEAEIGLETYRGLLARLVDILKERLGPSLVSVVLYGSVARGVARPDSDVDLLVVLDNPPSNYHRSWICCYLQSELSRGRRYTGGFQRLSGGSHSSPTLFCRSGRPARGGTSF